MKYKYVLLCLVLLTVALSSTFLIKQHNVIWDEAVYIGMGKYFYSFGKIGLFETIRPPALPIMIGFLGLFFDAILCAKLFAISLSAVYIILVYFMSRAMFNEKIAIISAAVVVLTPFFITYSNQVFTEIPAAVFIMLALLSYMKNKPAILTGFLCFMAFIFKFPAGLILLMLPIIALKKKDLTIIYATFAAFLIPYFAFNYLMYDLSFFHAILYPWILAAWHQGNPAESLFTGSFLSLLFNYGFYFVETIKSNPFFLFVFVGLASYQHKKKYIFAGAVLFLYFTVIMNKQIRFALLFLPFFAAFAGSGIYKSIKFFLSKDYMYKFAATALAVMCFSVIIFNLSAAYSRTSSERPAFLTAIPLNNISGPILTSNPVPAAYIDRLFIPVYDKPNATLETFKNSDANYLIYSPDSYWCEDDNCLASKETMTNELLANYILFADGKYDGDNFYFLSKQPAKAIRLSKRPMDKQIIILREDDAAAIYREDGKNRIWNSDKFFEINNILSKANIPVIWALIPNDLLEMDEQDKEALVEYYAQNSKIAIAQHGFNHYDNDHGSEFIGKSYDVQKSKIGFGKKVIDDLFEYNTTIFIPPYNKADHKTIDSLNALGFRIYSGQFSFPGIISYPQTITFDNKTLEQLEHEFDWHQNRDYVVIVFHPYNVDIETFDSFISNIKSKDVMFASIDDLYEWQMFRDKSELRRDNETITINAPDSTYCSSLTLLLNYDVNYNIQASCKINAKNIGMQPIKVCLNNICQSLGPNKVAII